MQRALKYTIECELKRTCQTLSANMVSGRSGLNVHSISCETLARVLGANLVHLCDSGHVSRTLKASRVRSSERPVSWQGWDTQLTACEMHAGRLLAGGNGAAYSKICSAAPAGSNRPQKVIRIQTLLFNLYQRLCVNSHHLKEDTEVTALRRSHLDSDV